MEIERKASDRLSEEKIRRQLGDHPWRDAVRVLPCVDSTNDLAKQLAAQGAPEGTAVLAESQRKGRGRLGRQFSSPAGAGIYLSVILRPAVRPEALMHLTAAAAVALAEAVEARTGLDVQIKWVNDLLAGGKKLAGILTELSCGSDGLVHSAVLGVGLNCCQRQEDFPPELREIATSVAAQTGVTPERNALAAAMLRAVAALRDTLFSAQDDLMARYSTRCATVGKRVRVINPAGERDAFALCVDRNAALLVEYTDGQRAWLSSGEVSVRGKF